jgi:PAS domain S-box-containing protein
VNAATEEETGVRRDQLIGTDFCDYFTDPEAARRGYEQVFNDGQVRDYPLEIRHRDGGTTPVLYNASLYRDENGEVAGVFAAARDITGQKKAENALRESLREKEVLLREVHHRVKNNLAAVIGLIDMQRKGITDRAAIASQYDLCSRIKSMAMVHERLYRSENLASIDFQEYLKGLVSHLRTSYGLRSDIRCRIRADGVRLGLDLAVPSALIVNELVTNAFKYAFPEQIRHSFPEECEVRITAIMRDGDCTLEVADNGAGFPPDLDWQATGTLGLRLVRMLGEHQLGGKIDLHRSGGTRFVICFAIGNRRI